MKRRTFLQLLGLAPVVAVLPKVVAPVEPALATGGLVRREHYGIVGEHGPEAIVPLPEHINCRCAMAPVVWEVRVTR